MLLQTLSAQFCLLLGTAYQCLSLLFDFDFYFFLNSRLFIVFRMHGLKVSVADCFQAAGAWQFCKSYKPENLAFVGG